MILLALTPAEVGVLLLELTPSEALGVKDVYNKILTQSMDKHWNPPRTPRTILIRDEGDHMPLMAVSYDRSEDAELAWQRLGAKPETVIEWP